MAAQLLRAIVAMVGLVIAAVVVLAIWYPGDATAIITIIIGLATPTIGGLALLLKAVLDVHTIVNSQKTAMLDEIARLRGQIVVATDKNIVNMPAEPLL